MTSTRNTGEPIADWYFEVEYHAYEGEWMAFGTREMEEGKKATFQGTGQTPITALMAVEAKARTWERDHGY